MPTYAGIGLHVRMYKQSSKKNGQIKEWSVLVIRSRLPRCSLKTQSLSSLNRMRGQRGYRVRTHLTGTFGVVFCFSFHGRRVRAIGHHRDDCLVDGWGRLVTEEMTVWWMGYGDYSPERGPVDWWGRLVNREVQSSNPGQGRNWFEISAPPAPLSQLSYDEYTDRTLSVWRWDGEGENWPPALICRG